MGGIVEAIYPLVLLFAVDNVKPNKVEKELEKLDGTWHLVSVKFLDEKPIQEEKSTFCFFKKGLLIRKIGERSQKWKFHLNPNRSPKEIDLTPLEEPFKGKSFPGIYSFRGKDLNIRLSFFLDEDLTPGKRPDGFKFKEGDRTILWTLRFKTK